MSTIVSKKTQRISSESTKEFIEYFREEKADKIRINLKKKAFFRDIVNSEISNLIICHSIANDVNAVAMPKTQQRGNC